MVEAPEKQSKVDSTVMPLQPSFPALDRALAFASPVKALQPPAKAQASSSPAGGGGGPSSSLLQPSSYNRFRITKTIRPALERYPNIVATARLALSRHRGIRFQDRNHALRVVKILAEKSNSLAKVQAN